MGTCLCKGHKEYLQNNPDPSVPVLKTSAQGGPQPGGRTFSDGRRDSGYGIGELATSTLQGLVATIKEHITKPTAMAQGRVAHLIEWKGWGGGGGGGGGAVDNWRREGCGWGGVGVEFQEDEQLYSHLADEIKEARFAAGVAEQFALAEAAMHAWTNQERPDVTNGTYAPLQDPDDLHLSSFLLDGVDVSQRLYRFNQDLIQGSNALHLPLSTPSCSSSSPFQLDTQHPLQERRTMHREASIHQADSISLSEDEVFYN
ncbi:hypothetical protein AGOR_G00157330 [Albula goreensis]|uniref:Family with sequence similarity 131 member C n=1 Tax=Albula goreensis TaxID=1534307 RepID=A0A8T3CZL9_9TELE|nr:hypothetical protein AGOR_G00157330 [Albula goreensis]